MKDRVIWRDEAHAINLAASGLGEFLQFFAYVEHQTAYLVILRLWTFLFGTGAVAASALSLLSVWAAAWLLRTLLCRLWGDTRAADFAAALLLLAPMLLQYNAFAIRPYAFSLFANLVVAHATVSALRRPTFLSWFWLFASMVLSANAQPVNLAFCGACSLAFLAASLQRGPALRVVTSIARGSVHGALLLLAALPMATQSLRFSRAMAGVEPRLEGGAISLWTFVKFLRASFESVFAPAQPLIDYLFGGDPGQVARALAGMPWVAAALAAALLGMLLVLRIRFDRRMAVCAALLLVSASLLTAASAFHVRMIDPGRTLSVMAPLLLAMLARPLARHPAAGQALLLLILLQTWMFFPGLMARKPGHMSDGRDAAAFIYEQAQPEDLIVLANPQLSPTFSYYYDGPQEQRHHPYAGPLRYWDMVGLGREATDSRRIGETVEVIHHALETSRRVWLVTSGSPAPEPGRYWYCPDALPLLESAVAAYGNPSSAWHGSSRIEPFHAMLYTPAK